MKTLSEAYEMARGPVVDSKNCVLDNLDRLMTTEFTFTLGGICAAPFIAANQIMDLGINAGKRAYRKLRKKQLVDETPHEVMMNWLAARGVDFSNEYYGSMGDVEFAQTVYDAYVALHG